MMSSLKKANNPSLPNERDEYDRNLITTHLAGDPKAFDELIHRYSSAAYAFLIQYVRDRETAEDLTQETFVKVWRNLSRFDTTKSFRTWMFTIAKNTAYDWLRRKKPILFSALMDDSGKNPLDTIESSGLLPIEFLSKEDDMLVINQALEKISESHRSLLHLVYRESLSLREASEILGEPYNTVKSRHLRAVQALRKEFGAPERKDRT